MDLNPHVAPHVRTAAQPFPITLHCSLASRCVATTMHPNGVQHACLHSTGTGRSPSPAAHQKVRCGRDGAAELGWQEEAAGGKWAKGVVGRAQHFMSTPIHVGDTPCNSSTCCTPHPHRVGLAQAGQPPQSGSRHYWRVLSDQACVWGSLKAELKQGPPYFWYIDIPRRAAHG